MNDNGAILACTKALLGRLDEHDLVGVGKDVITESLLDGWHLSGLAVPRFLALKGDEIPSERRLELERCSWLSTLLGRLQKRLLAELSDALKSSGIKAVALKGCATRMSVYEQLCDRSSADIDLGVQRSDLGALKNVLSSLGYKPGQYNPGAGVFVTGSAELRNKVESEHYELGFWVLLVEITDLSESEVRHFEQGLRNFPFKFTISGNRVVIPCTVDVHHALSLDIPLEDLMERARVCRKEGVEFLIPSMAWIAFYALFKTYWEAGRQYGVGSHNYIDAIRAVEHLNNQEASTFIDLVEKYRLCVGGHYLLRRCDGLGINLSSELKSACASWRLPPRYGMAADNNDIGDFAPRLFGFV